MADWRAAGINRVSIGVQSLDAGELVVLGRDHRQGDGAAAVRAALDAGFATVSADLILGVPVTGRRGDGALPPHLAEVARSGVPHLSVYELTIEERTAFGRRAREGTLVPLDEDRLADLYAGAHAALGALGFEHYEVSSYAKPGHRAVHNSLYWTGAEFLGLGVGAASFWRSPAGDGRRWTNVRETPRYLRAVGEDRVAERLELDADEVETDALWLAMRTCDGVAADRMPAGAAERLLAEGLVEERGGRVRPTLRGFLYNDRIAAQIVAARDREHGPGRRRRPPGPTSHTDSG